MSDKIMHVIDCDADPVVPYMGWKVEEHRKGGQLTWSPEAIELHLSPNQMNNKQIEGSKLRQELLNQQVLNANVLDYLIHQPQLIPDDWKVDEQSNTRFICFWDTIYRRPDGDLCFRYLFHNGGHWQMSFSFLVLELDEKFPAAARAG